MLKVAITGASGMLGRAVLDSLNKAGCSQFPFDLERKDCDFLPITIEKADIRNRDEILSVVREIKPDAVINCAAYTDVDGCETNKELAFSVNAYGAGNVARAAAEAGALFIHISTDYVFDGWRGVPYRESDRANPLGIYGESKYRGEVAVSREAENYFILRTAWLYGAGGKNFVDTIVRLADEREELSIVNDQTGCPTYTVHLAAAITRILKTYLQNKFGKPGVYHITGDGSCTWHDFAGKIIELHPGRVKRIIPITTEQLGRPAPRPKFSILSNEKIKSTFGIALPHWEDALAEYLAEKNRETK